MDGFRCDVASLVPLNFWLEARQGVAKVRPDAIWLSESVEESFVSYNRSQGQTALSELRSSKPLTWHMTMMSLRFLTVS